MIPDQVTMKKCIIGNFRGTFVHHTFLRNRYSNLIIFVCVSAASTIFSSSSSYLSAVESTRELEFVAEVTKNHLKEREVLEFVKPDPDQVSQRALDEADRVVCMMPKHSEYIKRNFE
ncbi:hypothetical protein HRED_08563 [Candidatus Haloredivivus sp. G17]|nr:hypothetical protein HRED_08563 [Candidatus Haloredivivus sp. G17]